MDLSERIPTVQIHKEPVGSTVVIAGWAQVVKSLGKIAFIHLRDREGIVQVTVLASHERFSEVEKITPESVLVVRGRIQESKQKSGGNELILEEYEVLSPARPGVPIDVTGKTPAGLDTRLDNRYLDLRNPKHMAIFKIRTTVNHAIRTFLRAEGFLEMQTPKIISAGAEGGATLFPVQYYDKTVYLSQSQQLYKQMMLIAGFEKIFEIGPSFRAEKSNTNRHQTEFTQLDFEMSFINDYDDVLKVCETVKNEHRVELEVLGVDPGVPPLPFPRVTYEEGITLLQEEGFGIRQGDDIGSEEERALGRIVKKKYGTDAYFITRWPYELKPFYIMTEGKTSYGFDLEYKGEELCSGGQREHRHDVLCRQIEEKGLNLAEFEFYTTPFAYGAPPHGGFGMGIDRIVKKMLDLENIREAILFPRDPDRVTP